MSLPLSTDEITFETFLQELPEDFRELAYEFKVLCRSRKIKTPENLLQGVMNNDSDCERSTALERSATAPIIR